MPNDEKAARLGGFFGYNITAKTVFLQKINSG